MSGLFSPALLEQIRSANDIIEVIGGYVPLKRAGTNFVALCPFHKEKSPSFNVNPQRQIFHCFGCHKGGDVFTFIKEFEGIGFTEAVRRLAERAHIPLEIHEDAGQQQVRFVKETLLQLHEQIAQRWQAALRTQADGEVARAYLKQRGVDEAAIELFRLGYAPDLWDDTVNWANSRKYDLKLVEQAGLIIPRDHGGHYDRFRGRLMFPICDEQGRVVAFSGRVLTGDEKTAKYVNSPETPLFTKGKTIFGLDKSKRSLLDTKQAVICEGQLDLIACFTAGIRNVVAPQGTALTADQCRLLKRYVEEVVLCFDSDAAGQNAAVRSLDPLLASGLAVRVAVIPSPHDPDSFIKAAGPASFQELIDSAKGFFDYYLQRLSQLHDPRTDKGKLAIGKAMFEGLAKADNPVLTDTYTQQLALRLAVSPEAIRAQFRKFSHAPTGFDRLEEEVSAPAPKAESETFRQEIWLLKLLLLHDEFVPWIDAHLDLDWLVDEDVKQVVAACLEAHRDHRWHGISAFLDSLEIVSLRSMVTAAVMDEKGINNAEEILKGTATRAGLPALLRSQTIDRRLAEINRALSDPQLNEAAQLGLLQNQQACLRARTEPLRPRTREV